MSTPPAPKDLLADLTEAQAQAVTHRDGPLLILAGAGSGKTRVITRRVAYLLSQGVRAHQILAITFTNKAAGEMRHRVEQLVGDSKVWVSTFHSMGARLLRQYADTLNIDRNFTIYDTDDRNKLVRDALNFAGIDDIKFSPERISGAISKAKNQLLTPKLYEQQATEFFSQTVAKIYHLYEKRLRAANGMDFDDLLYLPALALRINEAFRADLDRRFKYILIDEYQDTNQAQYEIARRMSINYPNLCVVGDPDQSIYKWRGSDIKNILDFERDFPDTKVITLEQNYRSTQSILHAASVLIDHNTQRKKKTLVTENAAGEPVRVVTFDSGLDEADGVVERIKSSVAAGKFRYRDHAIFVRINALTRTLEGAFIKHGVPFQIVKGLAFFERKENKDVIAYCRLLVNPADTISFLRAVNEPPRGVGKVSLERLQSYANANELTLLAAAERVGQIPEIKGKAVAGLRDLAKMLADLRGQLELPPHEMMRLVIDRTGYRKMLAESGEDDDADRLANIEELVTAAQQFHDEDPSRTLADFLEQITLASDVDGWDESADHVSVMTFHAAKGLEFPAVYLMAVEQGILPHERSLAKEEDIEEERRLCFVGMTRAMRELTLTHCRLRDYRGQALYSIPSTFLEELPPEVLHDDQSASKNTARTALEDWRAKVGMTASNSGYGTRNTAVAPPKTAWPTGGKPSGTGEEFEAGQVVQHESYGIGQLTEVSGFGSLKRLKVRFAGHGEKTFIADKVQLKVVKRA